MRERSGGRCEGKSGSRRCRARRTGGRTTIAIALLLACALPGCEGRERPPALVLVTVDTLRADHLGAYGSDRGLTPNLDSLARRSVVFESAYATAPFTVPSVASILTGRFPEALGVRSNETQLPRDVETLASTLRAAGWRTAAVVSNFVLRRASGLDRGFEVYDDRLPQREATRRWPERTAPVTTTAAVRLLREIARGGGPFFLWVHYQDPHGPYTPPEPLRAAQLERERAAPDGRELLPFGENQRGLGTLPIYQRLGDEREVAWYRAGYAGEVAYTDAAVGRLLEALDALGLRDRATVVFTADHGEGLGAHDYWFAHGEYLTDELTRVPLLVADPRLEPGRRDDLVTLVDLYPTLLRLVGVEAEALPPHGRDLLAPGAGREDSVAYLASLEGSSRPRVGLVRGDHKVVGTRREDGMAYALHPLGAEDRDLAESDPGHLARMIRALEAVRATLDPRRPRRQELTDTEREALRALGYLEEEAPESP